MRTLLAVSAKRVIHTMGEDHAETPRESDSNFAPVRRQDISEVRAGADEYKPEQCCSEHASLPMPSVTNTDCRHADDRDNDGEQPMGMFL
jgi:hypothetical protein